MDAEFALYDEVLHHIYDAALNPQRWPTALDGIAAVCGATVSLLFTPMHTPAQGGFIFTHKGVSQASVELWAGKSMADDPHVHALVQRKLIREGVTGIGADLVPLEALQATAFYRDLWAPMDIAQICFGIVFDGTDGHKLPTAISVFRSPRDPVFDARHVELMQRLVAHLSRALGVMYHLRDQQLQVASSLQALERLPAGVVLLDGKGRVHFANRIAHQLFASPGPLCCRSGALVLTDVLNRLEREFQQAVQSALRPLSEVSSGHFSDVLLLPDVRGRPSYVLHVAPLGTSVPWDGELSRAVVFIYDLAAAASVSPKVLCKLFDLTPAEARAALQVLHGGTSEEMAQRLGVAHNTFKTQIKAAYAKTNTHRQVDFLKLLLALSAVVV